MSFEIRQISVNSTDNIHTLMGKIYIPEGEVKGLIHVVHGMTEYIDRYDNLMSCMAEAGHVAFGYDHLGHGKTAKDDTELGFIAHNDGWKYLVNDVGTFSDTVRKMYPGVPTILFGHSMGSFITRLAVNVFPDYYKKLIICGTSGKNPLAGAGLILTDIVKLIRGEKHVSKLVNSMAFGSYNKRFDGYSKYDWLSKERNNIAKYADDKYCNFSFTVSAMHDLITLIKVCNQKKWFAEIDKDMPILLISGSDDPVGNYGKGVTEVFDRLKGIGANATIKLYDDCRHEILNDTCREEVISDILRFVRE